MASLDTSTASDEEGNMQTAEEDELALTESCGSKTFDFSTKTWREDMELIVEGRKLFVASNILSLLSPVFTSMFDEQFKWEGPKVIELPGKKINDVTEFLRCIYPSIHKNVSLENVHSVLPLADEFKVHPLKTACEDILVETTTAKTLPEDICFRLQLAFRYKLNDLKEICMKHAAAMDDNQLKVAEIKYPLPHTIKTEVQDLRIVQLNEKVTNLQKKKIDLESRCQNVTDFIKYFWIENTYNSKFLVSDFRFMTLTIDDVRQLPVKTSSLEYINGIGWSIYAASTKNKDGVEYLSVSVSADAPKQWKDWSCEVLAKIMILNNNTGKHYEKSDSLSHTFTPESSQTGYSEFIAMSDLLSGQKYVVNGVLTIKMFMLVKEPRRNKLNALKDASIRERVKEVLSHLKTDDCLMQGTRVNQKSPGLVRMSNSLDPNVTLRQH